MLKFAERVQIVFLRVNGPSDVFGYTHLANSLLIMVCEIIFIESLACVRYCCDSFYI